MAFVLDRSFGSSRRDPLTRAVVVIEGKEYQEWETVQVRCALMEVPANTFRFTTSEQILSKHATEFKELQILPPQKCEVFLDNILAIRGQVVTRQVGFDKEQHTVEIQGEGYTGPMNKGSFTTQTGEFKDQNILQLAKAATKDFGINVQTRGQLNLEPIKVARVLQGESHWAFLERYCRMTKTFMGETREGDLLLVGGEGFGQLDWVEEGVNMLAGSEVIHSTAGPGQGFGAATMMSQYPGNDDKWGADPTHQRFSQSEAGGNSQFSLPYLPKLVLAEAPGQSNQQLGARGAMDSSVDQQLQIFVTAVVMGWQRNATVPPGGGLWERYQKVHVKSPMLIMDQELILRAVTFKQGNPPEGTTSTLDLVNPAAFSTYGAAQGEP